MEPTVLNQVLQPGILDVGILAMQPEARLLSQQGGWALMESTLPLLPINAPDEPTPTPAPMLLGQRFNQLKAGAR